MTRQIQTIPEHLAFDGTIPTEAAHQVLSELAVLENQLSPWQKARLGKITASCFESVKYLRGSTNWGEQALTYLYDLIGEHITGQPSETFTGSKATDWGNQYEEEAIKAYTQRTGKKTHKAAFMGHPTLNLVGATPDRFVGEKGLIEAKCPLNYKNHLRTVINKKVPTEYMPQVLGQLWLSGREWCDFISYDPRIKTVHRLAIVRVRAEDHEEAIDDLKERIAAFHELLLENLKKLKVKPIQSI